MSSSTSISTIESSASWAPKGDRIAYFARTEKNKTLVIQNVVNGRVEQRFSLDAVDGPESPAFSPDGTRVAFSALQGAVSDIFMVDLSTGAVTNLTNDAFADYSPTFAPDGRSVVYTARVSKVSGINAGYEWVVADGIDVAEDIVECDRLCPLSRR